ncbi:MAG: helix-turn-helix transcriptional regulator [Alicyclobacillus sp.]|nr:helix-turn-helix transcriptional regulator [Alicyclobacillus sp.]
MKAMLDDRGIKQKWLADKIHVSPPALNLIIHGKTLPTLRTAQKIARVLNTSVDELWPYDPADDEPSRKEQQ